MAHGWDIVSPIHVGSKILVTGAGIIGNLWVCALHLQGHRNVTVSEPNTARLDMLRRLGKFLPLIITVVVRLYLIVVSLSRTAELLFILQILDIH